MIQLYNNNFFTTEPSEPAETNRLRPTKQIFTAESAEGADAIALLRQRWRSSSSILFSLNTRRIAFGVRRLDEQPTQCSECEAAVCSTKAEPRMMTAYRESRRESLRAFRALRGETMFSVCSEGSVVKMLF